MMQCISAHPCKALYFLDSKVSAKGSRICGRDGGNHRPDLLILLCHSGSVPKVAWNLSHSALQNLHSTGLWRSLHFMVVGVRKNGDVIYIRYQSPYYQCITPILVINFLVSRSDETLISLTLSRPPRACADRNETFLDASLIDTHPPGTSARSSLSAKHFEVANTRVCHYHFPVSKHRTRISTTIRVPSSAWLQRACGSDPERYGNTSNVWALNLL